LLNVRNRKKSSGRSSSLTGTAWCYSPQQNAGATVWWRACKFVGIS